MTTNENESADLINNWTILHEACLIGDIETVKVLLEALAEDADLMIELQNVIMAFIVEYMQGLQNWTRSPSNSAFNLPSIVEHFFLSPKGNTFFYFLKLTIINFYYRN